MWNDLKTQLLDLYAGYRSQDNTQAAKLCSKIIGIMDKMEAEGNATLELTNELPEFKITNIVTTPDGVGDVRGILDHVAEVYVHSKRDRLGFSKLYRLEDLTFVRDGVTDAWGVTY